MTSEFDPYHKWLGIPRDEQPANHYRLLGVSIFESDAEVIANAVDRRVAHLKQFVAGPYETLARKILSEISTAKLSLLQPAAKASYDQLLQSRLPPPAQPSSQLPPAAPLMAPPQFAAAPRAAPSQAAVPSSPVTSSQAHAIDANAPLAQLEEADPFDFTGGGDRIGAANAASTSGIQRGANRGGGKKTTAKPPKDGMNVATLYMVVVCTVAATLLGVYFFLKDRIGNRLQETDVREAHVDPKEPAKKVDEPVKSPIVSKPLQRKDLLPEKQPEALPAANIDPSVNLLATVDLMKSTPGNESWGRAGEQLTSAARNASRVDLPYRAAPQEYDLTIRGARRQNLGEVAINLPTAAKTVTVALDITSGTRSWFGHVGTLPKDGHSNVSDLMLPTNQPFVIVAKVRKDAIGLIINGRLRMYYVGDLNRLDTLGSWRTPGKSFALGTLGCSIQIDAMKLLPASGPIAELAALPNAASPDQNPDASPPLVENIPPVKNPIDVATNNPPKMPDPIKPAAPDKKPVPSKQAQEEAQGMIRELFKDEFAKARKPEERFALAKKIFEKGLETRDDPTSRFTALWMAADMAAHIGDWIAVMETIGKLDEEFAINAWDSNATFLEIRTEPFNSQNAVNAIDPLLRGVDSAVTASDYRMASRIMVLATKAARKAADKEITQKVQTRAKEIDSLAKQFDAIKADIETLKADPANAAAITNVGRWYCFAQGDWDRGLPLLSRSNDAALKKLATADLAHPAETEIQVQNADAWWDRADAETDTLAKNRIQQHAAELYRICVNGLSGLSKAKAEKRIAEVDKSSEGRTGYVMITRLTAVSATARNNMLGLNKIPPGAEAKTPPGFNGDRTCSDFIYAHARSELVYDIPDGCKEFRATGYAPISKNVKFVVEVDNRRLLETAPSGTVTIKVDFPLKAKRIKLTCESTGDSKGADSFWCYPRLYR